MLAFRYILTSLGSKLKESLLSVLPVSVLVVALSLTPWVDIPLKELNVFVIGALMLILGIGLFNLGADMAMTPMGQYIGEGLTKSKRMGILIGVAFVMGTLITIAEPDLAVLAEQVHSIMNGTVLIATVGVGVSTETLQAFSFMATWPFSAWRLCSLTRAAVPCCPCPSTPEA